MLGTRYFARKYITLLVEKDLSALIKVFYDESIFRLDADELFSLLERIQNRIAIFKISKKLATKQKKVDMLRVLQIFDKLINSGMKSDKVFLKQKAILDYSALDRPHPSEKLWRVELEFLDKIIKEEIDSTDINERQRAHYLFISRYLPFDMTE